MNDKKAEMAMEKGEKTLKKPEADANGDVNGTEKEVGGFENRPEPTRFGDWDVNGRCSDF